MENKIFIESLKIQNFLSFGANAEPIKLDRLNVLIGPNASGKSNLIEAIALLHAAPTDLTKPIREGGGIAEWLWKGTKGNPTALIEAVINNPESPIPLRYRIAFTIIGQKMELMDEIVENERRTHHLENDVYFFYRYERGEPVINVRNVENPQQATLSGYGSKRSLRREDMLAGQSVLSQRKDRDIYPEITYLGQSFSDIRLYREWSLGRFTIPRLPQRPDDPDDFLLEDGHNLGLILNNLDNHAESRELFNQNLRKLSPFVERISIKIQAGSVQVILHEKGASPGKVMMIPATRLSDGTLRYLCLLAVLCHPHPPPLICIEEPELGLHPDLLYSIAKLLVQASNRTQLIVSTHSEVLVSALSDYPESVLICERNDAGTRFSRLDPEALRAWLDKYSLGELWRMGELGGIT